MPEYSESPLTPTPQSKSISSVLVAAVLGLVLFLLAIAGYAWLSESGVPSEPETPIIEEGPSDSIPEGVACTMDAKICPDGSAVGRSGPNCEFDPCPGE